MQLFESSKLYKNIFGLTSFFLFHLNKVIINIKFINQNLNKYFYKYYKNQIFISIKIL
jgi:hypothetical protein